MKEKALHYYQEGYNCTQCILKAAEEKFGLKLPKEALNACGGVSNGFGIGSICGGIVGAVMVFGILFSEDRARLMRLELFMRFHEKNDSLNCCALSACRPNCDDLLGEIAGLAEEIILEEIYSKRKKPLN